jgi:mRNA-degrading endonuclease RelE of RelBE toxin-antitoxin system
VGKQSFLSAEWSERWKKSYGRLGPEQQAACDRAAIALIKKQNLPGLRIKPIRPEKYYLEARLNRGDRIVFRIEGETIFFVDVISHDEIDRYGRRG